MGPLFSLPNPLQGTGYSFCRKYSSSRYPHCWFTHPLQVWPQQGQPWLLCLIWQQSTMPHPHIPDPLTLPALTFPHSTYHLPTYYIIYSFIVYLPTPQCMFHEAGHFCLICSWIYSKHIQQYLAHVRSPINVCFTSKYVIDLINLEHQKKITFLNVK